MVYDPSNAPDPYNQPIKRKRRWIPWLVLTPIVLVIIIACSTIGASLMSRGTKDTVVKGGVVQVTHGTTPPVKTIPVTIGDGTWRIGKDVKPGKYRSIGARPTMMKFCAWSVKANEDQGADLVDFGTSDKESDPQLVTLKKGQVFDSAGCAGWAPTR